MEKKIERETVPQDAENFEPIAIIKSFYPLTLLKKIYLSIVLFAEKGILNFAASGAFYFLLSIIPLALIFVTVLDTYLAGYGKISDAFFNFLSGLNPDINKKFFEQIGLLGGNSGKVVFGIVGGVGLIWSSRSVFSGMKSTFDIIFDDGESGNVILNNLIPFIFVPIIFALSVLFFVATALFNRINALIERFGIKELSDFALSGGFSTGAMILFVFGATFCLYRFLPARRPATLNAFTGAVLFTLSILLMQNVFYKIVHVADYYLVYGVISVLIAGLYWVYIMFALFYLFAQFVYVQYKFSELEFAYYYTKFVSKKGNFIEKALFGQPYAAMKKFMVHYEAGSTIIENGDAGGYLYVMISGFATADKANGSQKLETGEMFGESGVLSSNKYDYTVKAETVCAALKIPKDFYERVVGLEPKFLQSVLDSVVK